MKVKTEITLSALQISHSNPFDMADETLLKN